MKQIRTYKRTPQNILNIRMLWLEIIKIPVFKQDNKNIRSLRIQNSPQIGAQKETPNKVAILQISSPFLNSFEFP